MVAAKAHELAAERLSFDQRLVSEREAFEKDAATARSLQDESARQIAALTARVEQAESSLELERASKGVAESRA